MNNSKTDQVSEEKTNVRGNTVPNHPTVHLTTIERMATPERREGPSGFAGLVKNPYVFATAIFASIGGLLCE
ncbi:hypothetical protein BC936DRAFT_141861 [Jimgerdemannia flammicorona]|uniref:Uncharacterized protein n=2 Tax=Jimgerdemannia flammicorona TaxID=994334 RepID=A0A433QFL1_9FUNG|nr:hypothetical protein BC936DRAFT_141861 [Jimgerdemannia flammicorona]RUS28587.1 hypothetical protein BC938DRAFT_481715 [Jimgerdemannia flammicorona]